MDDIARTEEDRVERLGREPDVDDGLDAHLRDDGPDADDGPDPAPVLDVDDDESDRRRRLIEHRVGWAIAIGAALVVFWSLDPVLIFRNTTPTGGDMGAHVWGPRFLIDHLLPQFRVTGWTQDWYAGFPAYVFYMVVPSLIIVWLTVGPPIWLSPVLLVLIGAAMWWSLQRFRAPWARVLIGVAGVFVAVLAVPIPYNVAFKMVTVSGLITLPLAAYVLGRAAKVPFPGPPLIALATLPFIYDKGFTILGGNGASTMAGEFAFSISLTFAMLYLAVLFRGIRTGRDRALGAVLLALTIACHLIPAIFAGIATFVVIFVRREDRVPWWDATRVGRIVAGVLVLITLLTIMPEVELPLIGLTVSSPLPQWWFPALASLVALALFSGFQPELTSYFRDPRQRLAAAGATLVGLGVVVLLVALDVVAAGPWLYALVAIAIGLVLFAGWDWRAVRWLAAIVPVGIALTGFWSIPFLSNSTYMNDMGWEKYTNYTSHLLGREVPEAQVVGMPYRNLVFALAGLGIVLTLIHRVRFGYFLSLTVVAFAWIFRFFPQYRLWNARLLPFLYLFLYLLAGLAIALVIRSVVLAAADLSTRRTTQLRVALAGTAIAVLAFAVLVLGSFRLLPGGVSMADPDKPTNTIFRWAGLDFQPAIVNDWARWNFAGLEGKPAFTELDGIMDMMATVGDERGCGRAMWEYDGDFQRFGTPMALMLLPYFTDGCIGSMEGLYFEASSTTPFHFLNQSELSEAGSRAQRDMAYSAFDIDKGIAHLQLMGVRYYMATSALAIEAARNHEDLTEVAAETFAAPGADGVPVQHNWAVFEVADSDMVVGLENDPVVLSDADDHIDGWVYAHDRLPPTEQQLENGVQGSKTAGPAVLWYNDPARWNVFLATSGPDSWPRAESSDTDPPQQPNDPVEVTKVRTTSDSVSFEVDEVGVPVLVKVSYFPNWKVSGAEGPYRVSPNFMVVVPTENEVVLTYGYSSSDLLGWIATLLGLAGLAGLVYLDERDRRRRAEPGDVDVDGEHGDPSEPLDPDDGALVDGDRAVAGPTGP